MYVRPPSPPRARNKELSIFRIMQMIITLPDERPTPNSPPQVTRDFCIIGRVYHSSGRRFCIIHWVYHSPNIITSGSRHVM